LVVSLQFFEHSIRSCSLIGQTFNSLLGLVKDRLFCSITADFRLSFVVIAGTGSSGVLIAIVRAASNRAGSG
jgi:hypothetical protein